MGNLHINLLQISFTASRHFHNQTKVGRKSPFVCVCHYTLNKDTWDPKEASVKRGLP